MQWDRLLSDARCPKKEGEAVSRRGADAFRSHFEADYDRIVYSTPFRRLARKTQVHPLAANDQVHNRLTHSLEVASVGRSLARRLAAFLQGRGELPAGVGDQDLMWIMQAACLAHDIGNPPFGHAGEFAIREWVKAHPGDVFGEKWPADLAGVWADMEMFEGNAQGFRIGARADNPQAGYLRLTMATLGATVKYPWDSQDPRAKETGKLGVFSSELWLFEQMARELGMVDAGTVRRHPLSFLTEAADDICYRVLDLEDAVEMGILKERQVREVYASIANSTETKAPLSVLRGHAISALIDGMWGVFERNYEEIMEGKRRADLKTDLDGRLGGAIESIKNLYPHIFAERSKVAAELGAYKSLGRIIKALCVGTGELAKKGRYDEVGFLSRRCLELAWGEEYAREQERRTYEWWLHQVLDYVSSLTDNYARQLSREIEGT